MSLYEKIRSGEENLSLIGLGYVGMPIAVAFAKEGDNVIGFDLNQKKIELYKSGIDSTNEVGNEIIKNTYRTLMTRGQKGCFIYCTDKKLSDYLKRRLNQQGEIMYSIDETKTNNMMVAEDNEEYKYE